MIIRREPNHALIQYPDTTKPLMRGWFHGLAAIGAIVVTLMFVQRTTGGPFQLLAALLFGLSMIILYTVSATLHLGNWDKRTHALLCRLDYANIFLVIAGTYTPINVAVLEGWLQVVLLVLVWLVAIVGICAIAWTERFPPQVLVAQYVGLALLCVSILPMVAQAHPISIVALLLAGAIIYGIGAIVYVLRRPNPWPATFGFHELFHLCVIGANAATLAGIWPLITG